MFHHSKENLKKSKKVLIIIYPYLLIKDLVSIHVAINNLAQWRTVVSLIKNGSNVVSSEKLNGFVDQAKNIPQLVHFRCGLLHIKDSVKKIRRSYILQPCLFKQELEHDENLKTHGS